MKVFVGGSKSLKTLPEAMRAKLDDYANQGAEFLIGDCRGVDALAQSFLAEISYKQVIVYATEGKARSNVGDWDVHGVDRPRRSRHYSRYDDYAYYLEKDRAMVLEADIALMAWNGRSRGTFVNIVSMVALGKAVDVTIQDRQASHVETFDGVHELLPERNPKHRPSRVQVPWHDKIRALDTFIPSRSMASRQSIVPLYKWQIIDMVLGSPLPLEAKLEYCSSMVETDDILHELVDEVEAEIGTKEDLDDWGKARAAGYALSWVLHSSFSLHRNRISKALDTLHAVGPNELVYRKAVWDEQPTLFEAHEAGIAPFHTFEEALDDLRFEIEADEIENSAADDNCWTVFEKWRRTSSGAWKNTYTFYAIGDEVVFFEEMSYNAEGHYWEVADSTYCGDCIGNLNLRTPFKVGDIVTFDCRPFAPLEHGIVLEPERDSHTECCLPWVMSRRRHQRKGSPALWGGSAVKHGAGLHVSMPGYSLLYRLETYEGELLEEEQILHEVQEWLDGNPEKGKLLDEALKQDMTADEIRRFMSEH